MGTCKRVRPQRLPEKLFAVREWLGASQPTLARLIGFGISSGRISEFESGRREPNLLVLLSYARAVGISTDTLIDDSLDLAFPDNPATPQELIESRTNTNRAVVFPPQQPQQALAGKLFQIRKWLKLTQPEIVERLRIQIDNTLISMYEHARRHPPLSVLLAYAHLAGIPLEQIVDDALDLNLPNEAPFFPDLNHKDEKH